jgi:hypothetical protein
MTTADATTMTVEEQIEYVNSRIRWALDHEETAEDVRASNQRLLTATSELLAATIAEAESVGAVVLHPKITAQYRYDPVLRVERLEQVDVCHELGGLPPLKYLRGEYRVDPEFFTGIPEKEQA